MVCRYSELPVDGEYVDVYLSAVDTPAMFYVHRADDLDKWVHCVCVLCVCMWCVCACARVCTVCMCVCVCGLIMWRGHAVMCVVYRIDSLVDHLNDSSHISITHHASSPMDTGQFCVAQVPADNK